MKTGLFAAIVLAVAACAGQPVQGPADSGVVASPPAAAELPPSLVEALAGVSAAFHTDDNARKAAALDALIADPHFATLPTSVRHYSLRMSGALAYDEKGFEHARTRFAAATTLPEADAFDWSHWFHSAFAAGDVDESIRLLRELAVRHPAKVGGIRDEAILYLAREAEPPERDAEQHFQLLSALFDSGWKMDFGIEPPLWSQLVEAHVARGEADRALAVARRVVDPYAVIELRADRRFDALLQRDPAAFDVALATRRQREHWEAKVKAQPRRAGAVAGLSFALLEEGRFEEAVALAERALVNVDRWGRNADFSDWDEWGNWVMDNRARGLMALGRTQETLEQWQRGSREPEHGDVNVSQGINLAQYLCGLGRPREALEAIGVLGSVSDYGSAQVADVRLCAGLQLKDRAMTDAAFAKLQEHAADAPATWQDALLETGKLDQAAEFFKRRLADPRQRAAALRSVQGYAPQPGTPRGERIDAAFRLLIRRPDVRAEIDRVGRVEEYPFLTPADG